MKPGRIPCEVIGCRRTADAARYEEGTRIICGKCWRYGSRRDKWLYRRCDKLMKQGAWRTKRGVTLRYLRHQAFERILKRSIECQMGIGT